MIDFTDIHGNALDIGDAVKCYYAASGDEGLWTQWADGVVVALESDADFYGDSYIDASTILVDIQGYDMVEVNRNGESKIWVIEKVGSNE